MHWLSQRLLWSRAYGTPNATKRTELGLRSYKIVRRLDAIDRRPTAIDRRPTAIDRRPTAIDCRLTVNRSSSYRKSIAVLTTFVPVSVDHACA